MTKWMWLVLLYGVLKGVRDVVKKKALEKSTVIEVLFFYTLIGFLFVIPETGEAMQIDMSLLPFIFGKSFIIFIAWLCGYAAISKMPISLYGVMDLARVLFATILGLIVLNESFSLWQGVGLFLVMLGLILVNLGKDEKEGKRVPTKYLFFALVSCLFNAMSGVADKLLMNHMTDGQLQFWYMLFLLLMYLGYLVRDTVKGKKIAWKKLVKNYWIPVLSVIFMIGDRALFVANGIADSKVTVMTLLKQSCVLITILGGWIVFREKRIVYRLICAGIVVSGIVIATIGA